MSNTGTLLQMGSGFDYPSSHQVWVLSLHVLHTQYLNGFPAGAPVYFYSLKISSWVITGY